MTDREALSRLQDLIDEMHERATIADDDQTRDEYTAVCSKLMDALDMLTN